LETCCGYGYELASPRGLLLDFQDPRGRSGHRRNCGVLRIPNPISLLEVSRELERLYRKENSSGSPDGVSRSFWVTPTNTLTRARIVCGSVAGFRNRNRIPFRPTGELAIPRATPSSQYVYICLYIFIYFFI